MNLLLLIVDSLRADAPSFAGGVAETETLDALAAEGCRFERAFASGAWTIPSLLSMLTGRPPHHLGVARWRHPFPEACPTLLSAFEAAGFEVFSFVPHPRWGLLTVPGRGRVGCSQDPAAVVEALRGGGEKRDRLILVHHWWTHLPYLTRTLDERTWFRLCEFQLDSLRRHPQLAPILEASYRGALHHLSEELLPRYLEAATAGGREALVVVTSDHGENWGTALPKGRRVQNVYDLHGRWICDETIQIPLIFWGRSPAGAIPARLVGEGIARGVDLAPTIAELAGLPWKAASTSAHEGHSLARCVLGEAAPPEAEVLTVTSHNAYVPRTFPGEGPALYRTLALRREERWVIWDGVDGAGRVVEASTGQVANPEEQPRELFERLEAERLLSADPGELVEASGELPAELDERLGQLGYLDGA